MHTREKSRASGAVASEFRPWMRERFALPAEELAAELIGRMLVRTPDDGSRLAVRIVETEAYVGIRDRASHAFGGRRTPRNEAMYAPPGTAYVYFTYGMHYCFNVVCGRVDEPLAVLVRAAEPVIGAEVMAANRAAASKARDPRFSAHELCNGPARLCQAMMIRRELNGLDLTADRRLFIADPLGPGSNSGTEPFAADKDVIRTARIGVGYSGSWAARRLRWLVAGHPCVSVRPSSIVPSRVARARSGL